MDEVQQKYFDPREDGWARYVAQVLKLITRAELARQTGVSERFIQMLRNGSKRRPSPTVQANLTRAAADYVREKLGANPPTDDIAACAAYLRRLSEQQRNAMGH